MNNNKIEFIRINLQESYDGATVIPTLPKNKQIYFATSEEKHPIFWMLVIFPLPEKYF